MFFKRRGRKFHKYARKSVIRKSTRAIAKRAERTVKKIQRGFERKYLNQTYSTTAATAGDIVPLTNVAQGDTAILRDGNAITCRSIKIQGSLQSSANTAPDVVVWYRIIIFQDKQQVADTEPAVTDLLLTAVYPSVYNYPNALKRFKILWDKVYSFYPHSGAWDGTTDNFGGQAFYVNKWIFPTQKQILFNGAAATDFQKGTIYMLTIGSATTMAPNFEMQMCFTDN